MRAFRVPVVIEVLFAAVLAGTSYEAPTVSAQANTTVDPSLYSGMRWRSVGPARGGRSLAVGGSDARPMEYWFGATGGGAWKTTDGGNNWAPMTDGKIDTSSIGSLAVCQSNPDVVYIGGGETQFRGNIIQGDGVYKTTDGGVKWDHLADLRDSQAIARLRVHPTNCDIVYAAVLGQVYNEHPQRGIFKSADGGKTWRRTLFRDEKTGGVDLSIDPKNPERDLRRRSGKRTARRGACRAAAPAAACSSPPTPATRGSRSPRTPGCRPGCGARSACRCRAPTAIASTR